MIAADPFDMVRAEVMLAGYDARWGSEAERYEVLGVECEFRSPLVNPDTGAPSRTFHLGGKLDLLLQERFESNRKILMEHKTASGDVSAGSDYLKRLRMDGQISVYYAGALALGHQVDACIYDVLVKPALRPLKVTPVEKRQFKKDGTLYASQRLVDETPAEYRDRLLEAVAGAPADYFMRAEVVRLDGEVTEAMADVWQLGRTMRESELAGRAPRNPDACVRYGRTCEYFPVCSGEASLEDPTLYRKVEAIHPELSDNADLQLLTVSRLANYRACARLHHIRYGLGIRPAVEADTLRFGSLIHRGLEAWWKAAPAERLEAAMAAIHAPPAPMSSAA